MARTLAPARQYVCRLDGANVARFGAIVDRSGVLDLLTTWREEDRAAAGKTNTGGRPRYISDRTMLIAFLVVATSNSPLHITRVAGLICAEHTTDTAREALGLPTSAEAERVGDAYDKQYTRWYHRAHNALHRILDVVDLFPDTPTKRRLTHKELADILDNRDEALVLKRRGCATEFFNRLVWASYEELPEKYRENWKGDVTVDGTLLKGAYTGTRKLRPGDDPNLVRTSSEPDAAWYVRDGDHKATDKALKNAKSEAHWGYEATVIAGVIRDGGGISSHTSLWESAWISPVTTSPSARLTPCATLSRTPTRPAERSSATAPTSTVPTRTNCNFRCCAQATTSSATTATTTSASTPTMRA